MKRENVYFAKANAGTLESDMPKGQLPPIKDVHFTFDDGSTSYKSILQKVAAKMTMGVDFSSDAGVEAIMEAFNQKSKEAPEWAIYFGDWGADTEQGKQQLLWKSEADVEAAIATRKAAEEALVSEPEI